MRRLYPRSDFYLAPGFSAPLKSPATTRDRQPSSEWAVAAYHAGDGGADATPRACWPASGIQRTRIRVVRRRRAFGPSGHAVAAGDRGALASQPSNSLKVVELQTTCEEPHVVRVGRFVVMDFAALPPEINSGRHVHRSGVGAIDGRRRRLGWGGSGVGHGATSGYSSVISELTSAPWIGPSSSAMLSAVTPYVSWLGALGGQAEETASQATAAAAAFETAFAMTVPPPVIAANRVLLATLIATNFLGPEHAGDRGHRSPLHGDVGPRRRGDVRLCRLLGRRLRCCPRSTHRRTPPHPMPTATRPSRSPKPPNSRRPTPHKPWRTPAHSCSPSRPHPRATPRSSHGTTPGPLTMAVEHHRRLLHIWPTHPDQQLDRGAHGLELLHPTLKEPHRFTVFRGRSGRVRLLDPAADHLRSGYYRGWRRCVVSHPAIRRPVPGRQPRRRRRSHRTFVRGHQDRRTLGALQLGHHPRRSGHRRTRPQSHHRQLPGRRSTRQQRHPARHADDRRRTTRRQRLHPQIRLQTQRPHPTPIGRIKASLGAPPIFVFRAAYLKLPEGIRARIRQSRSSIQQAFTHGLYPRQDFIPGPAFIVPPRSIAATSFTSAAGRLWHSESGHLRTSRACSQPVVHPPVEPRPLRRWDRR